MLLNETIQSLHGGVSTQNLELRRDNQCEDMINVVPTLAQGVRRRNPSIKIKNSIPHNRDMWSYTYKRGDNTEEYLMSINSGENTINIMDKDGNDVTVNYDGTSQAYLLPNNGKRSFRALTIKDTTFILNKEKEILEDTSGSSTTWSNKAYVWVQRVDYNFPITTTLVINGTTKTATYPDNTSSTEVAAENIRVAADAVAGVTATRKGSIVEITGVTSFSYSDTLGDSAGSGWFRKVQMISDLPLDLKYEGAIVEVENSAGTDKDNYYVKFENGVWIETLNPTEPSMFLSNTMPHKLTRNTDGTFTLQEITEWGKREKGDDTTAPTPSFVGDNIKDLFFMKNRLGFVTNTTIVMSEIKEYYNFYRTTTLSLLDDDPIDFQVDSTEVVNMEYCTFLQSSLLVFSENQQFKIDGGDILSPRSVQAQSVTAYSVDMNSAPISLNNKVFFATSGNRDTKMVEYVKDTNTRNIEGAEVTLHVPDYIPKNISALIGSSKHNMLFLLPDIGDKVENDTVYVYKYHYEGDTLVQSAWFKWTISGDIYNIAIFNDSLMLMNRRRPFGNTKVWDDDTRWLDSTIWSEDVYYDTVEKIELDLIDITDDFIDNVNETDQTEGGNFESVVTLSKWLPTINKEKVINGHLDFKTVQVNSVDNSEFTLVVDNTKRNKIRFLLSKYVVGRRPFVGGLAKDVRISIYENGDNGFQIGSIAREGRYTSRGKRLKQ